MDSGGIPPEKVANLQERYSDVVTDTENHTRSDYALATLEMKRDYFFTGFLRLKIWATAHTQRSIPFLIPLFLLAAEVIFITDMMGATSVLTKYLNGSAVEAAANNPLNPAPDSNVLLPGTSGGDAG